MRSGLSTKQVAKAYGRSPWLRGYVRGKLIADPVFRATRRPIIIRGRQVVDIGCGLGILGISLRASGIPLRYWGADPNARKINLAKQAMRYFGFEDMGFAVTDALSTEIPPGATVCVFDVIHYLPPASQEVMLSRLADAVESGSLVLLRSALKEFGPRYALTLAEEWWTRLTGWIRGGAINFPTRRKLLAPFEDRGIPVRLVPMWGFTPFGSRLLVAGSGPGTEG